MRKRKYIYTNYARLSLFTLMHSVLCAVLFCIIRCSFGINSVAYANKVQVWRVSLFCSKLCKIECGLLTFSRTADILISK